MPADKCGFALYEYLRQNQYVLGANDRPQKRSKIGCTLIFKRNVGVRAKHFVSPKLLVLDLK